MAETVDPPVLGRLSDFAGPAGPGRGFGHAPASRGLEDAVARSQEIADTVDIELELGKRFFPVFQYLNVFLFLIGNRSVQTNRSIVS